MRASPKSMLGQARPVRSNTTKSTTIESVHTAEHRIGSFALSAEKRSAQTHISVGNIPASTKAFGCSVTSYELQIGDVLPW
jgi:hypothetical protein